MDEINFNIIILMLWQWHSSRRRYHRAHLFSPIFTNSGGDKHKRLSERKKERSPLGLNSYTKNRLWEGTLSFHVFILRFKSYLIL